MKKHKRYHNQIKDDKQKEYDEMESSQADMMDFRRPAYAVQKAIRVQGEQIRENPAAKRLTEKGVLLMQGDCLELLKDIPDDSVDMVLCDLPYGVTDYEWDRVIDGKKLFAEYKRICKQNANVLLFCQIGFAKYLMDSTFTSEFSHCLIWVKSNKTRHLSSKNIPMSQYEMILCFRLNKYSNKKSHKALRDYFMQELERSGKTVKEIESVIPNYSAHHWFRYSSDYRIPTKSNYRRLQEVTGCFNRPYEEVKQEFQREKNNSCTYNKVIDSDVLYATLGEKRVHPTQKPVNLLEQLISTYSNPGQIVLDNCMGSGSTGVACVNTGRKFIGMELDPGYFEVAKQRIEEAQGEQIRRMSAEEYLKDKIGGDADGQESNLRLRGCEGTSEGDGGRHTE